MKFIMNDYSQYYANQNTPKPDITLDQAFDIIEYRNDQFDDIKLNMPELDDSFSFFAELERRVILKKKEMGLK